MEHHCCCQEHGCEGCGHHNSTEITLSRTEAALLARFAQSPYLPLARFLAHSSREDELEAVGLSAVFLDDGAEKERVKETGRLLEHLEELGLITLDYDIPLSNYDYTVYENSGLYAHFRATVAEGGALPGFLFDTPALQKGSMALTDLGCAVLEQI